MAHTNLFSSIRMAADQPLILTKNNKIQTFVNLENTNSENQQFEISFPKTPYSIFLMFIYILIYWSYLVEARAPVSVK